MITIPGRIPIQIFPLFWVLIFLLGWMNTASPVGTLIWAVVIFFSVLIHEYGHALTALVFGQEAEIGLVALGGVTKRSGRPIKSWQEFIVVLNGPCAGFLLFFLIYFLSLVIPPEYTLLTYATEVAMYVNLFWNVLNLIPIFPLDGGHLLRILLESMFGLKGVKIAIFISLVLAGIAALFFFLMTAFFAGAIFLMLAIESYRAWSEM